MALAAQPATHYDLQRSSLAFLCLALAEEDACFTVGSGASAPDVPLISKLPERLRPLIHQVGGFPAELPPRSPFTEFIELVTRTDAPLDFFKLMHLTGATLAVGLEQVLQPTRGHQLAQYAVFELFAPTASVVVFNWDSHAFTQCPQPRLVYPHGRSRARLLDGPELDDLFFETQTYGFSDGRDWLTNRLILPGDESGPATQEMRRVVLREWLTRSPIIGIGYGFGLNSRYDHVWRDDFVAAIRHHVAPVHIIDPNAAELVAELSDRSGRRIEMHAWPFHWRPLARALLSMCRRHRAVSVAELALHAPELLREYERVLRYE